MVSKKSLAIRNVFDYRTKNVKVNVKHVFGTVDLDFIKVSHRSFIGGSKKRCRPPWLADDEKF